MREAKVRWNLQWSVIFLAIAYGIVEEGLMVKSFFNPGHVDMGILSAYGSLLGIQWVWTVQLIIYHAVISILMPIAIIELLWPEYKNVPLLQKKGLILTFTGISLVTIFGMIYFGAQEGNKMVPYHPHPLLLVGSFLIVVLLVWLAHKYRNSKISTINMPVLPSFIFGICGFIIQAINLIIPGSFAEAQISAVFTIITQFFIVALIFLFVIYQIYNRNITKSHMVSFVFGSILFYILLTPVHEFVEEMNQDPTQGMLIVGIVSLVLLVLWRYLVLKRSSDQKK